MPCLYLSFMSLEQSGLERDGEPNRNDAVLHHFEHTWVGSLGFPAQGKSGSHKQVWGLPQNQTCSLSTQRLTSQSRKSTELTSLSYPSLRVYRVTPYLSSCEGTAVARDGTPGMDPGWDTAAEKGKCPSQNGSMLGSGERA